LTPLNVIESWNSVNSFIFYGRGEPLGVPPTFAELHSILGPPARAEVHMTADQTKLLYGSTIKGMLVDPRDFEQWNAHIYCLHLFGKLQIYTFATYPWDGLTKQRSLFGENSVVELGC
jgi:hypothetical protein